MHELMSVAIKVEHLLFMSNVIKYFRVKIVFKTQKKPICSHIVLKKCDHGMAPYIDHDLCFKTLTSKYLGGTYTVSATAMRLPYS